MENLLTYFLVFLIYAFIGWIIEICNIAFETKKLVNRGFLIGPYCPIYGVGSLIITLMLTNDINDLFGVFVKAMVICAILEYVTSYALEKIFKRRWWDYSRKTFHINGRICLETLVPFGLGGVILIKFSNPIVFGMINSVASLPLMIIGIILFVIFMTDVIVSFNIINSLKKNVMAIKKDSTEEISKKVREILESKSYFRKRIFASFPYLNKK